MIELQFWEDPETAYWGARHGRLVIEKLANPKYKDDPEFGQYSIQGFRRCASEIAEIVKAAGYKDIFPDTIQEYNIYTYDEDVVQFLLENWSD